MDDGDRSVALEELSIKLALDRHKANRVNADTDVVARHCEECGVLIPEARVMAVNAVLCVECQGLLENSLRKI
jgi:phage/conjugal plasmid C-4 type zinc finger TraR family protein